MRTLPQSEQLIQALSGVIRDIQQYSAMFRHTSEISGLLPNTLTAEFEYSRDNRDNLPLPIQMKLSKKPKTFRSNFIAILVSTLNFEHFQKGRLTV